MQISQKISSMHTLVFLLLTLKRQYMGKKELGSVWFHTILRCVKDKARHTTPQEAVAWFSKKMWQPHDSLV